MSRLEAARKWAGSQQEAVVVNQEAEAASDENVTEVLGEAANLVGLPGSASEAVEQTPAAAAFEHKPPSAKPPAGSRTPSRRKTTAAAAAAAKRTNHKQDSAATTTADEIGSSEMITPEPATPAGTRPARHNRHRKTSINTASTLHQQVNTPSSSSADEVDRAEDVLNANLSLPPGSKSAQNAAGPATKKRKKQAATAEQPPRSSGRKGKAVSTVESPATPSVPLPALAATASGSSPGGIQPGTAGLVSYMATARQAAEEKLMAGENRAVEHVALADEETDQLMAAQTRQAGRSTGAVAGQVAGVKPSRKRRRATSDQ